MRAARSEVHQHRTIATMIPVRDHVVVDTDVLHRFKPLHHPDIQHHPGIALRRPLVTGLPAPTRRTRSRVREAKDCVQSRGRRTRVSSWPRRSRAVASQPLPTATHSGLFRGTGAGGDGEPAVGGVLCLGSLTVAEVVAIHLCGLPGEIDRTGPPTFDLAPGGGCLAAEVALDAGALLPHRFTLACSRSPGPSAVCSLLPCTDRSPRPGSHQHPVLRSPDLPRRGRARARHAAATKPAHRPHQCPEPVARNARGAGPRRNRPLVPMGRLASGGA